MLHFYFYYDIHIQWIVISNCKYLSAGQLGQCHVRSEEQHSVGGEKSLHRHRLRSKGGGDDGERWRQKNVERIERRQRWSRRRRQGECRCRLEMQPVWCYSILTLSHENRETEKRKKSVAQDCKAWLQISFLEGNAIRTTLPVYGIYTGLSLGAFWNHLIGETETWVSKVLNLRFEDPESLNLILRQFGTRNPSFVKNIA